MECFVFAWKLFLVWFWFVVHRRQKSLLPVIGAVSSVYASYRFVENKVTSVALYNTYVHT
jgi:hypothetical protein